MTCYSSSLDTSISALYPSLLILDVFLFEVRISGGFFIQGVIKNPGPGPSRDSLYPGPGRD